MSARRRDLFVSPHLDDAVFACGERIGGGCDPLVVTVFAGFAPRGAPLTAWDRECGFVERDDVVAARRAEDASALRILGATPAWLDFRDDQYGEPRTVAEIMQALADVLTRERPRNVFVPLGLFHADHRRASDAALALVDTAPACAWFAYDDAIYRRIDGAVAGRLAALAHAGYRLAAPQTAPADMRAQKRAAVACYRSQLRALRTRAAHDDVLAPERYRALARAGADR